MTTPALRLRDQIVSRLSLLPGYTSAVRKTPVPQLQPDALPALSVYITNERLSPDGDANVGEPRFVSEVTIAIADVRGFEHPTVLDGSVDAAVDLIETTLLSDPTFVGYGQDPLSEAVTGISRRRLYPQNAETYFAELRLEMTFVIRVSFEPTVPDDLDRIEITSRQLNADPQGPAVRVAIDIP